MGNLCGSSFVQQERVTNNRHAVRNIQIPNSQVVERERVLENEEKFKDMDEHNSNDIL